MIQLTRDLTAADGRNLEYATAGWSGGGPHALACAALHEGRCVRVATLAGVAPRDAAGLDFLAGMGPENVDEFGAAAQGEATLRGWMAEHAEPFRTVTGAQIAEAFGGLVPQIDRDVLQGGYADHMAAGARARTPRSRAHLAGHRAPAGDPRLAGG